MKTKKRLFLLGTGYPWYLGDNFTHLTLMDGPNRQSGRERVSFKPKWGAYQKVRIWIEKVD